MQIFGGIIEEINKRISDGNDIDLVFDFMFDSLKENIPYDRMGVALIDDVNNRLTIRWMKASISTRHLTKGYFVPLNSPRIDAFFKTGRPLLINDMEKYLGAYPESELAKKALEDGVQSNLACPLRMNGKNVGLVFFSSVQKETYRTEHVQAFLSVAEELALLLERERLVKLWERSCTNERTVNLALHDLRTPLTVMQTCVDLCKRAHWFKVAGSDAEKLMGIMDRNVRSMSKLIDELADLIYTGSQAMQLRRSNLVFEAFLNDVYLRCQLIAQKKDIEFKICTSRGVPVNAWLDADRIVQVLDNLMTNAVKFSKRGSKIVLEVWVEHDRLCFSITDQGQGIPENELSKLFKEFGKTSVLPTEGERSSGLGLSIARRIVELHEGAISVASDFGKGSTFTFWIPLIDTPVMH